MGNLIDADVLMDKLEDAKTKAREKKSRAGINAYMCMMSILEEQPIVATVQHEDNSVLFGQVRAAAERA